MQMARRLALLSCTMVGLLACEEKITSPGACPEFCPTAEIEIIDLVLTGVIERDTSFQGYVQAYEAAWMQVVGGGAPESWAVIRFARFSDRIALDSVSTAAVVQSDSFRLDIVLEGRSPDVTGLEINVHRIPITVDSLSTFASVAPFFHDSTIIGVIAVPDTNPVDTVSAFLPADAFPTFVDDEREAAVGLSIRGTTPAFATVNALDVANPARLVRFAQADSADGVLAARSDQRIASFDTFVQAGPGAPPPSTLVVGGTPSTRAFLRVNLPPFIIDSSDIIGAILLLIPTEPVFGAPSDTFNLVVGSLGADFGPKSPILVTLDSTAMGEPVPVGTTDTLALNITSIVSRWQDNPALPRTLVLRIRTEAAQIAELRLGSSQRMDAQPAIRVTYVPPFSFVQR